MEDVVGLEEGVCIRPITHAELVLTTPAMGYESKANHSRCEICFYWNMTLYNVALILFVLIFFHTFF